MRSYVESFIKKKEKLVRKFILNQFIWLFIYVMLKRRISLFVPLISDFNVKEQITYQENHLEYSIGLEYF